MQDTIAALTAAHAATRPLTVARLAPLVVLAARMRCAIMRGRMRDPLVPGANDALVVLLYAAAELRDGLGVLSPCSGDAAKGTEPMTPAIRFTGTHAITAADAALDSGAGFFDSPASGLGALWDAICCGADADDGTAWVPGGDVSCDKGIG